MRGRKLAHRTCRKVTVAEWRGGILQISIANSM